MAASLSQLVSRLNAQIDKLGERHAALIGENASLRDRVADLERETETLREQLRKAMLDNDYLRVSYRLAESPDEVVKARRMIDRIVRDIDRCISQLKE